MATVGKKTEIATEIKYPAPTGWMGLPPVPQIILGVVLIALGAAYIIYNLMAHMITIMSLVLPTLGCVSIALGLDSLRQKRRIDREMAIVRERFNELVDEIAGIRARGEDPFPFLDEQGIHNGVIRFRLIQYAKEKAKQP